MAERLTVTLANGETIEGLESLRYANGTCEVFVPADPTTGRKQGYLRAQWSAKYSAWFSV